MKGTKTSLFLIELMIALLLFAFCAAVCIQIFHASNERTKSAEDLSKAVFQATTVAELYKSVGGDLDAMRGNYDAVQALYTDSGLALYFDEEWNPTINPVLSSTYHMSGYMVDITENATGGADITVSRLVTEYEGDVAASLYEEIFAITVKAVNA